MSGLSFTQFNAFAAPTSALGLSYDGDQIVDATATATIAISGTLVAGEHDTGQVENIFSYQNVTGEPLYAFKLTPNGESMTIGTLTFALTGIKKVDTSNLTNIALYRDYNANGTVDGNDAQIGGTGALSVGGQSGTITFSSSWSATTSQNYLVIADTVALKPSSQMTVSLNVSGTVTGETSLATLTPTGSVSSVQHARGGGTPLSGSGVSRSGAVGDDAPPGQATTTGGGLGGGEEIGSTPGFQAPGTSGVVHNEWTSGSNGIASDGAYATAASTNLRQSYSVFGFSVPGGNTVTGIEVKLEASGSTGAGTVQVALSWDGGTNITSTKSTATLGTSDVVYTLGGVSDLWGRTWSPSEFSNANFFVRVISQPSSNTVRVDAIQVKPYHAATGGGGGGGGEI